MKASSRKLAFSSDIFGFGLSWQVCQNCKAQALEHVEPKPHRRRAEGEAEEPNTHQIGRERLQKTIFLTSKEPENTQEKEQEHY